MSRSCSRANVVVVALTLVVTAVTSCSRADEQGSASGPSRPLASGPSPSRVTDGLCEHGVLEAICPKCHPTVEAVFRAKGDWCEEHGFPESVCPTCHPERGGRPGAGVVVDEDEPPADGTKVRFKTEDTARLAGLETVRATTGQQQPAARALVRLTYDATKVALISAFAGGVVRAVEVDIGSQVEPGQVLARVDSASVGADRSSLSSAQAKLRAAEARVAREKELRAKGIAPQKDLEAAEAARDEARAGVEGARAALGAVGAGDKGAGGYRIVAPLGGVVTRRTATVGLAVNREDVLFEIVDPSTMWAELEVQEQDLAHVAAGQSAVLELDGLPDRTLTGTLDYVAPAIDPRTRTASARVKLDNDAGRLRANMFGRARILLEVARESVTVPAKAVQQAKGQRFVFVKLAEDEYEARRVVTGLSRDDVVEVKKGVSAGEEVVTTGAFLLKTEILKGAIGAGCCE